MYLVFQVVNIFLGFSLGFGRNSYGKSSFSFHRTEYKKVFETYSECIAMRKEYPFPRLKIHPFVKALVTYLQTVPTSGNTFIVLSS